MPNLLLVEDNLHIQRIFHDKLQREGFHVTTADDGAPAWNAPRRLTPISILLDIMLPKLDGFQVLPTARRPRAPQHPRGHDLSNRASNNDVQHATSLGARQFFAKGTSKLQDIALHLRADNA
jgi:DNA-binding response OmpR family regulator